MTADPPSDDTMKMVQIKTINAWREYISSGGMPASRVVRADGIKITIIVERAE
jgi:hypothetical protein